MLYNNFWDAEILNHLIIVTKMTQKKEQGRDISNLLGQLGIDVI